jgi:hypothetical protein
MSSPIREVSRVVSGFLGAPLISGVLYSVMTLSPSAGFFALIFAYPFAWMLGIPAYLLFRKMGWLKFWQVLLAGAVLGGIACALFSWGGSPANLERSDLIWMGLFIIHGAVVAAMFWLIAIKKRRFDHAR